MKLTHAPFGKPASGPRRIALNCHIYIREEITRIKKSAMMEFRALAGENLRLLRLALNEAEALAWQTDFPHLVFPALAMEKAQATIRWHQRQRAVRRTAPQLSFTE